MPGIIASVASHGIMTDRNTKPLSTKRDKKDTREEKIDVVPAFSSVPPFESVEVELDPAASADTLMFERNTLRTPRHLCCSWRPAALHRHPAQSQTKRVNDMSSIRGLGGEIARAPEGV
jgi:hypothetical protein